MIRKQSTMAVRIGLVLWFTLGFVPDVTAHEHYRLDERTPVCLKAYPTDPSLF